MVRHYIADHWSGMRTTACFLVAPSLRSLKSNTAFQLLSVKCDWSVSFEERQRLQAAIKKQRTQIKQRYYELLIRAASK